MTNHKPYTIFIILAVLCALCASCESPNCGELTGFWQLARVDSLTNEKSIDYREVQMFWSFEGKLMQTRQVGHDIYIYRFEHSGETLHVAEPYLYDRENGDKAVTEADLWELAPAGINQLEETFNIETLNRKKMCLSNATLRLHFEKY